MQKRRHFLFRTFGKRWLQNFLLFVLLSLILAFLPTILFINDLKLNIPKFCEDWLKNTLNLSAIFLIINYLNYQIAINRSKDKISMLTSNFNTLGEVLFEMLKNNFQKKKDMLNLVFSLETLIKKIQAEDEFFYTIEGLGNFSGYQSFFEKIKNYINGSQITSQQIEKLNQDFQQIKNYLNRYL